MKRLLLACLLCAACKHSSSASSSTHTETSTVTDTTNSESGTQTTTTTVTQAPGKTTTTVEEFAPPTPGERPIPAPDGVSGAKSPSDAKQESTPRPRRILLKRTVTVTETGGETTQTTQEAAQQATGATETHAAEKVDATAQTETKSAPALSCAFGGWLAILAVVVGVVGLILGALKMRKSV